MRGRVMSAKAIALAVTVLAALLPIGPGALYAEETLSSGQFVGQSRHSASGGVTLVEKGSGYTVVLQEDFSFDGAPDPKLAFGQDGYQSDTIFAHLRANSGDQIYDLPAGFDPSGYNEIWIWCQRYDVPLGLAKLR